MLTPVLLWLPPPMTMLVIASASRPGVWGVPRSSVASVPVPPNAAPGDDVPGVSRPSR